MKNTQYYNVEGVGNEPTTKSLLHLQPTCPKGQANKQLFIKKMALKKSYLFSRTGRGTR